MFLDSVLFFHDYGIYLMEYLLFTFLIIICTPFCKFHCFMLINNYCIKKNIIVLKKIISKYFQSYLLSKN